MKNIPSKKSERGSAILMTLGVLSIVMVLGMLFVATTRNTRTIAAAGADDVRAAVLSESAEAFALSILQEMTQTGSTYRPANSTLTDGSGNPLVQYQPAGGEDDDWHQPYVGSFQFAGGIVGQTDLSQTAGTDTYTQNAIFTTPAADYQTADLADVANQLWNPVRNSALGDLAESSAFDNINGTSAGFQNVTDDDGEIIGRYGFVILPEGSKINLNAIVNPLVTTAAANSIPAIGANPYEVALLDDGSMSLPDMPLGLSANPDDEKETGAFPIMGFDAFDTDDYGDKIDDELATLRYGLHPQEVRAPSAAYATPPGNAPKWLNYLQLDRANPTFRSEYALLFGLTGGSDEPEMVYDGDKDNLTYGSTTTTLPAKLAKMNLQFFQTVGYGWEAASTHLQNNPCILHGNDAASCDLHNFFRKESILGGLDTRFEFQDEDGKNINPNVMANLVDFCDDDVLSDGTTPVPAVTYLIDQDASIRYDTLETKITADNIKTLNDPSRLVCGNELAPAVIGVKFDVALEGGTFANKYEDKIVGSDTVRYYTWQMTQQHTIKLTPTISLVNIYDSTQMPTPANYKVKIAVKGEITETIEGVTPAANVEGSMENETSYTKTSTFFIPATENTAELVDPGSLTLSADIPLDMLSAGVAESFTEFNTVRAGTLFSGGSTPTEIKIDCVVTDVLVVLHPVDDGGDTTLISDIAYFHFDSPNADPSYMPPADAEDTFTGPFAAPTAAGATTEVKAFNANPANVNPNPWKGYALAKDPRCNDRWNAWNVVEADDNLKNFFLIKDRATDTITLGDKAWDNIVTVCGVTSGNDKDWEPDLAGGVTPGLSIGDTFSTAYIANEPFTSLWQLGAVHRYEVGRTINLRTYNDGLTVEKYTAGDAALLDFLKVTEATNGILGKFNPNCFNAGAYRYLLKDVPFGTDATIYRPVKGNQTLKVAGEDVDTFVNFETFSNTDTYKKQSWLPVQAFMRFCQPKDNSGSDREIEAFYGCTAGLLSTRYEAFTLITVGQSLALLDGVPATSTAAQVRTMGGVNPVQINGYWYSTLGTRVQSITILRDCWLNRFQIVGRQRL